MPLDSVPDNMAGEIPDGAKRIIEKAKAGALSALMMLLSKDHDKGLWAITTAYKEVIDHWEECAKNGDSKIQSNLGYVYYYGRGADINYKRAKYWLNKASKQGNYQASAELGEMYQHGKGVKQNYKKAITWYKKSSDQGSQLSQYRLGIMYYTGWGITQDYAEAFKWFKKSAHGNHGMSWDMLSMMYATGRGVAKNIKKANACLQEV